MTVLRLSKTGHISSLLAPLMEISPIIYNRFSKVIICGKVDSWLGSVPVLSQVGQTKKTNDSRRKKVQKMHKNLWFPKFRKEGVEGFFNSTDTSLPALPHPLRHSFRTSPQGSAKTRLIGCRALISPARLHGCH